MSGTRRMYHSNRYLTIIPILDILRCLYLTNLKPFLDSLQIVVIPVSNQNRFAVCAFDEVLQGIQFAVVDIHDFLILGIDSTVCHLQKFSGKSRCIHRIDFFLFQGNDHLITHFLINTSFFFRKHHRDFVYHTFRHFQKICRLHGISEISW